MDREGFRNRLNQYKKAREENPGLKYWEWKSIPKYDEGGKVIPTQEEYIAEQIAARKATALEKSLSRTMPRVPQGIKIGERWNPVTKKVEDIHECGPSCAYTFSDNYGQNWMGSEDFKQNHANYGWKQVPWEQRQPGNAVLIVDDSGTAKHTMMYDSDNAQGQPLFNHSNGGHDESAIRKKAKYPHHNPYLTYEFVGTPADSTQWINDYKKIYGFAEGGEVEPDPLEVLERSKPKFHGMPLAKGNIDGVFSPIDVPLATLPKVWSAVNKWLPNYGPTLGALIVGDNGQPVNKSVKPIATKRIEPDVEEFYRDIVIPLRPQEDYVKNIYLTRPGTFKYNVYPDDAIPSNRVAEYNPITGEIRVKESMLNSPQLDQTLAHDGSHDLEKLQRTKEAQDIIDEALVAQKNPISKESNLIQEKGAEVTRMGYNAFKYMKDHGLMQVKNPLAKTEAYQDYVLNATQEQLAEMMGDFTAYSRDYKAGKIDYDKIRWALAYAPEIAVGLIVPQHLLSNDKESKQWI